MDLIVFPLFENIPDRPYCMDEIAPEEYILPTKQAFNNKKALLRINATDSFCV